MTHRQPKLSPALRVIAASCIGLWLLTSSYCSFEHLLGDGHHQAEADASETIAHQDGEHSQEAEAAEHADGEANSSHDSDQCPPDSHPHNGGDDACCASLIASALIATPSVISGPDLKPLNLFCTAFQARDPMLAAAEDKLERQAKDFDWVFTPEVCLGPAHRSHAPPALA